MTTIVNTPQPANTSGGPTMIIIIALIVVLGLAYFGFVYGIPALRNMKSGGTQINVPDKIDINVNKNY